VTYKPAKLSAEVFENESAMFSQIDECHMCGEQSVMDDICYTCESCQLCWMTEEECKCDDAVTSVHAMTTDQFASYYRD
jgi:hypothetical protein